MSLLLTFLLLVVFVTKINFAITTEFDVNSNMLNLNQFECQF